MIVGSDSNAVVMSSKLTCEYRPIVGVMARMPRQLLGELRMNATRH